MARFTTIGGVFIVSVALLALSSYSVQPADASNILGVFLSNSPSHLIIHMSVMKALAEKGHNITVVSTIEPKVNHERIKSIVIPPLEKHRLKYEALLSTWASGENGIVATTANVITFSRVIIDMQFEALLDERFVALHENKDNKFDVVILGYFMNNFQLAIGAKFNCPIIISWMTHPVEVINNLVGNPHEISYVPAMGTAAELGEVMNLPKRIKNYFLGKMFNIFAWLIALINGQYYKKLSDADSTLPPYEAMLKNVSLVFCNSHFSEGPIRPLSPATILIGGIQVKEKPDPLPKNLDEFLAASKKNGAILFSLGSNLKYSHMIPETWNIVYKVLSSLKQNVIWKWDNLEETPGNASNILYQKWMPQDDILAHPNMKLFITHAGKGGVVESTYHGVPMVTIPMFGDQPANSKQVVLAGYGVEVDKTQITETILRNAIEEVLNNSSYANNIKAFSNLYRDRPLTARESVVYWTEYVIRHRGAAHMQSPLVHMNFIQSTSLDVHLIIVGTLYAIFKLLQLAVRFVRKVIRDKFKKNSKARKLKKQ